MGLDGISVNQLRGASEFNSAELNSVFSLNQNNIKIVDGLSNGQKVDPDKHKEHDSSGQNFSNKRDNEPEDEDIVQEEVTKYDLSDTAKYVVKLDETSSKIMIVEKSTHNVIQTFDADELSKFVMYSPNSCGSIINKKL